MPAAPPAPAVPAAPVAHAPGSAPRAGARVNAPRTAPAAPAPAPAPPVAAKPAPAAPVTASIAAPAAPAAPAASITDDQLRNAWPGVVAQLKKVSAASCALFLHATPRVPSGGPAEIVFPADKGFAYSAAQNEMHLKNFAAAMARALGREVPFALQLEGAPGASRPAAAPAVAPAPARTAPARPAPVPVAPQPAASAPAPAPVPVPVPAPAAPAPAAPAPAGNDAPADLYDAEADAFDTDDTGESFAASGAFGQKDDSGMEDFFASFGASFEEYE